MEVYIVPTITDDKILPTSTIHSDYLSNRIALSGCPGQYVPATFVIKAIDEDILDLTLVPSNLGTIPASAVDIRVVKCWYQAGYAIGDTTHKHLTPELLLKDNSLVKVEGGENYLKRLDGTYMWISDPTPTTDPYHRYTIDEIPVQDSPTLQPVEIPVGTNKQFWVTLKIPDGALPGSYTGSIELRTPTEVLGSIELNLEVLPIELLGPYLEYSIYYTARLSNSYPEGTISSHNKSEQQLRAELINLREHGVINPTVYQGIYQDPIDTALLGRYLTIRNEVGMGNQPLYYLGLVEDIMLDPGRVPEVLLTLQSYGGSEVYFYGLDEVLGNRRGGTSQEAVDRCLSQIPLWERVHELGGKMFVAGVRVGHYSDVRSPGEFGLVGDLLDLLVCHGSPSKEEAARWHRIGHRIFSYAHPIIGEEKPETYRRNYGLRLWQGDYDGAMPWAYNYATGNPWNDFDSSTKQMFGYPTINGVVDNMAFEGWREGVTDTRYLTTLLGMIELARNQGIDTSAAEIYLASLKTASLADLDSIRTDIINHILYLQGEPVEPPPVPPTPLVVLWAILPFFPWEGPPLPRFTAWTWNKLPLPLPT